MNVFQGEVLEPYFLPASPVGQFFVSHVRVEVLPELRIALKFHHTFIQKSLPAVAPMDIEDGDHDEHLKEENREEEPYEGRGEVVQQGHHSALLDNVIKWQDLSEDTQLIEPT